MINNVSLTGRLTRDVELRYTQSGTAVGQFTLATERKFTNVAGKRETDFINCVIWRKAAENFSNFTRKGSLVGIEGHIQTRTYDNAQGQRIYATEVIVDSFTLLETKAVTEARPSQPVGAPNASNQSPTQSNPAPRTAATAPTGDPFAEAGKNIDVSDDDLPF